MKAAAHKKLSESFTQRDSTFSHHSENRPVFSSLFSTNNILIQQKPSCSCGGACSRCQSSLSIQAKLKIGRLNDKYEQEADRMAEQVMRMSEPSVEGKPGQPISPDPSNGDNDLDKTVQPKPVVSFITPLVQRQEMEEMQMKSDGDSSVIQKQPIEEKDEELLMKRRAAGQTKIMAPNLHNDIRSLKGGGRPLSQPERSFFEPRFGCDFSKVYVHTGPKAASISQALNARAFTLGRDIVLGTEQYHPQSVEGQHLLAHELTHVIQQSSGTYPTIQRRVIPRNVYCRRTGVRFGAVNLTGDEAVAAITAADTDAITLARRAEELLTFELSFARIGEPVNRQTDTILREELGFTLRNPSHFSLIQQQINRFRRVRETLESGYLRYTCLALGTRRLVGCRPSNPCRGDRATGFACPGNRIVGLCRPFWFDPAVRAETILHEPFHIWFRMGRHARNALRRADASCFVAFAFRIAGQKPRTSCVNHTAG